jgi:hypothetical protein
LLDGDKREYVITYFHRVFDVENPEAFSRIKLRLRRADGAAVYLNGEELLRSNMEADPANGPTASNAGWAISRNVYHVYTFDPAQLRAGQNVIAVELHQSSINSPDMAFDLELQGLRKESTDE